LHHGRPHHGAIAQQVIDAHLGNAADLAQGFTQFVFRLVAQAAGKGGDDLLAREARTGGALHRQDERKPNLAL
jgi:hypothetical protein